MVTRARLSQERSRLRRAEPLAQVFAVRGPEIGPEGVACPLAELQEAWR